MVAAPGTITGLMLSSASVGGVVAPLAFGVVVDRWNYTAGWTMTAVWGLGAALLVRHAHNHAKLPAEIPTEPAGSDPNRSAGASHTEYNMQRSPHTPRTDP